MTDPFPTPPKETPKVDLPAAAQVGAIPDGCSGTIHRALRIFTLEQFIMFLDECEKMSEFGYGAVAMEFDHHRPNKVIPSQYKMLPKNDKAE